MPFTQNAENASDASDCGAHCFALFETKLVESADLRGMRASRFLQRGSGVNHSSGGQAVGHAEQMMGFGPRRQQAGDRKEKPWRKARAFRVSMLFRYIAATKSGTMTAA